MFELSVERTFCAAHAIVIAGKREPMHGHNWHVTVTVSGDALDADGLLCDFHLVERELDRVIGSLHNTNLNVTAPFDTINPTAELIAKHIADAIMPALPAHVRLKRTSVTEAPGCTATYFPNPS